MRKGILLAFLCLPMMAIAQTTLTPAQQLEQAQKQLEEAKAALEKAKAAKARADLEAKTKKETEELQKKIAETKAEAERVAQEAERIKRETNLSSDQTKANIGTSTNATSTQRNNKGGNEWVIPTTPTQSLGQKKADKQNDNKNNNDLYLQKGSVPEVNGMVIWKESVNVPGASADELYNKAYAFLNALTQESNQLDGSKVALINKNEHSLIATIHEKLVFSSSFLALDFTQFDYILQIECQNGEATISMSRLSYKYDVQGNVTRYTAEKWITDKYAMNKKQTRLLPISGKFRRATINRKDVIFKGFKEALQ